MGTNQHVLRLGSGEDPLLWAGRGGLLPGGLWFVATLLAGMAGGVGPRLLGLDTPAWAAIALATVLALAVAALRLVLIVRRGRRYSADDGDGPA
jgi:hypothetical protein